MDRKPSKRHPTPEEKEEATSRDRSSDSETYMKMQSTEIAKMILKKSNKFGGPKLPDSKYAIKHE